MLCAADCLEGRSPSCADAAVGGADSRSEQDLSVRPSHIRERRLQTSGLPAVCVYGYRHLDNNQ